MPFVASPWVWIGGTTSTGVLLAVVEMTPLPAA